MRTSIFRLGAVLAFAAAAAAPAHAQDYPAKPLTVVVPFAAGSGTDQQARSFAQALTVEYKVPVIVENRAGASGFLAAQYVAKAAPDGYTLLMTTNTTHAANEHLYKKLPYDPVKDFTPVGLLSKGHMLLLVGADSPIKSVADLVAAAKKSPGKLNFGSGSSSSRVASELLKQMAGIDMVNVPYKSNPMAITDLLGGQIDLMITDTSTGVPQVKAGKLRALGYSTQKRSTQLPDVPTIDEAGVKGYDMGYWFAAYAPVGTPASEITRLNELLSNAVKGPAAQAFFATAGSEPWVTTPDELARFQVAETLKWGKVIKAAKIEPE